MGKNEVATKAQGAAVAKRRGRPTGSTNSNKSLQDRIARMANLAIKANTNALNYLKSH